MIETLKNTDDNDARTCSLVSCIQCASVSERKSLSLYSRAVLSIYGGILFWVGAWDSCLSLQELTGKPAATVLYFLLGLLLTVGSDTLYANGAIIGHWQDPTVWASKRRHLVVRAVVGLFGTLLLWVGSFNSLNYFLYLDSTKEYEAGTVFEIEDCSLVHIQKALNDTNSTGHHEMRQETRCTHSEHVHEWVIKDVACLVLGLCLLVATGTFFRLAMIRVEGREQDHVAIVDHTSSWQQHSKAGGLAIVSLFGQCCVWLGAW